MEQAVKAKERDDPPWKQVTEADSVLLTLSWVKSGRQASVSEQGSLVSWGENAPPGWGLRMEKQPTWMEEGT